MAIHFTCSNIKRSCTAKKKEIHFNGSIFNKVFVGSHNHERPLKPRNPEMNKEVKRMLLEEKKPVEIERELHLKHNLPISKKFLPSRQQMSQWKYYMEHKFFPSTKEYRNNVSIKILEESRYLPIRSHSFYPRWR